MGLKELQVYDISVLAATECYLEYSSPVISHGVEEMRI